MKQIGYIFLLVAILNITGNRIMAQEQTIKPPVAKKIEKLTQIHGETLVDNYYWMREKSSPAVIDYLKAENQYTDEMMKPTEALQASLYQEMLARIKEDDENVPYKNGDYFYYSRTEKGKQYPIFCRKKGALSAPEEITLDQNVMAKDYQFFSLGGFDVSDDGNLLAFTTDTTGFRQYNLYVKDLRTGKISDKLAERVTSTAWANDNRTIFYTQEDAVTKRAHKFFRIELGSDKQDLLYEEKDELYDITARKTRSKGYVMLSSESATTSEMRYLPAAHPEQALKLFLPRRENHEYFVDHIGDRFYIRTNDQGKNFRLATAPVNNPGAENWQELIPYRKDVMLSGVECFKDHFVALERENGLPKLRICDLKTNQSHYIEFSEPIYVARPMQNLVFDATTYRYEYESLITPVSVFDFDIKTRQSTLLKQQPVLGGYDPKLYNCERLFATASDGTKVPISLVYKKDLQRNGQRPMLLYGYGSYGHPLDVSFISARLSLLDRGMIFAIAHIRGGGEMGKEWHDQGKMMAKKNTFTDFIACAEYLIKEKFTSSDRLVITGGSAGGLLMGAVTNMRPELFKAVVSNVPFVDVINTMLDASLPLTVSEYLEWGNPNEKPAYDYMKSYSPYDNIAAKDYPAMLVRTSLNDSQVMYWEPAKYVAKMRATKTDQHPLLFKIKLEPGGHGGASGRYDRLKDSAFDYAFILNQVGITK
jgi:oligopeptidase B